jgi:hypothetical protein
MKMEVAMAVAPAVILGFLAGLLSFRIKNRWCPDCGATLACPCVSEDREGAWTTSN